MNKILLLILSLIIGINSFSQEERSLIREGNKEYSSENYGNSIVAFKKALKINNNSFEARFNLGDTYYKRKNYDKALNHYDTLINMENDKNKLSKVYHNIGNCKLKQAEKILIKQQKKTSKQFGSLTKQKALQQAINKLDTSIISYKNALRNNPNNKETKYNMVYAQQKKKELESQLIKQKNKNSKKNKDQNDKKDKKDKKDNKEDQNDKKDKGKNNKADKKNANQQKNKISKKDALRLLKAIENDEKKTQNKIKKTKVQVIKRDKEW